MSYKKADELLPIEIIKLIQQYVDGQNIYIPRKPNNRLKWGSGTDIKQELLYRNQQIYWEYLKETAVQELANKYYLSEKSIQRIVREIKKQKYEL